MNLTLPIPMDDKDLHPAHDRFETTHGGPQLSVVVPTLNECANIGPLVSRLHQALAGIRWEVIFVDDDSGDETHTIVRQLASLDPHVRGIRRIDRRGLAGACLEGILSSSAPIVAIMDADLQHDERCLAEMFKVLGDHDVDLVVATRYGGSDKASRGFGKIRHAGSRLAIRLAQTVLKVRLTDPMSGFFMLRRKIVDSVATRLSRHGFKILFDIVATSETEISIKEISYVFSPRLHGESKLDASVVLQFLGLVASKASLDLISPRLLGFAIVGTTGVAVHLAVLRALLLCGLAFPVSQTVAMLTAMVFNYTLNNAFTYRDRRRRGWRFLSGLGMFAVLCSFGTIAGVGVSSLLCNDSPHWWVAGLVGAVLGAAWNFVTNSAITWRAR